MSKGVFITGTGTDVGKTYITALLIKKLRQSGMNCGYYKAAISGADSIAASDAGYVNRQAHIGQEEESLVSYLYKTALSPHLAANIEGNSVEIHKIGYDYAKVCAQYSYVAIEGSGGIICPIRYDSEQKIMLTDLVKLFQVPVIIVANAGLGTINSTVLTVEYLRQNDFCISGIILNQYVDSLMCSDNRKMIEELTGIQVIATVKKDDAGLCANAESLAALFQ